VIIINKGRVIAVDTPANLNRHLRRSAQVHVEVSGPAPEILAALRAVPGVMAAERGDDTADGAVAITVTTAKDRDLREAIAGAIGAGGWGLRELRPVTLSLEDIFLSLVADPAASPEEPR
jgi:ABC-2 type transport system ATP-binding protein